MQIFHQPVQNATQGDRVGLCVTQFDSSLVERCLISSPGHLHAIYGIIIYCLGEEKILIYFTTAAVIRVFKIPYYKSECKTGGKFHGG